MKTLLEENKRIKNEIDLLEANLLGEAAVRPVVLGQVWYAEEEA